MRGSLELVGAVSGNTDAFTANMLSNNITCQSRAELTIGIYQALPAVKGQRGRDKVSKEKS